MVDLNELSGLYGANCNGQDPVNKPFVLDGAGQYLNTYPVQEGAPGDGAFTLGAGINPCMVKSVDTIIRQAGGELLARSFPAPRGVMCQNFSQ